MIRIFKNGWFERFARKENLSDSALAEAVTQAESGLIDVDLGVVSSSSGSRGPARASLAAIAH
ncbi:type II toxin-antitoxin system RelE/ParE family toxin [Sphingomonas paeninsulae]|uniref:type II toxin-antitoxin system RelE/ParE family toxin n=1 Tax=Sphingomonas paeninsulae TaxID=2319844 RepID=UPI0024117B73|nr:type II toxin-antitoxin system RelE/ParE family toxin [Sphingomonas paeninsulae]